MAFGNSTDMIVHVPPEPNPLTKYKTKQSLPNELIDQIILNAPQKSDLYSWCLFSQATRELASPILYKSLQTVNAGQLAPIERVIDRLFKLMALPAKTLKNVRSFEVRYQEENFHAAKRDTIQILTTFELFIDEIPNLETFVWDCCFPIRIHTMFSIIWLEKLTSVTIQVPPVRSGYGFVSNKMFETQMSQFENLRKFELHGIWFRSYDMARCIAKVLRNSPRLTEFAISMHNDLAENLDKVRMTELNKAPSDFHYHWVTGQIGGRAPSGFEFWESLDGEVRRDQRNRLDFFETICEEFRYPTDDLTGECLVEPGSPMPPLSLTRLHVGSRCTETSLRRREVLHFLTDWSTLEEFHLEQNGKILEGTDDIYKLWYL